MNKLWWVVIGLAAVIVLMILFDRDPEPVSTQKWKDTIAQKEVEIKELEGNLATIREKVKADSLESIKSKKVYESSVSILRRTVGNLNRNPIIVRIRDESPEVDSLLTAQDKRIKVDSMRIVELESEMKDLRVNMDSVNDTFEEILQAERTKFEASQSMNKDLEKQVKKEKRKGKFAKVLIPAVGLGMLFLGAEL